MKYALVAGGALVLLLVIFMSRVRPLEAGAPQSVVKEGVASTSEPDEPPPADESRADGGAESQDVQAGNYLLRLEVVNGRCAVAYASAEHQGSVILEVAPPCAWILDHQRSPRMEPYTVKGVDTLALVVVGGASAKQGAIDPVLASPCGTQAQGVLVSAGQVGVSQQMFEGSSFCPTAGMDEKLFWLFAHQDQRSSAH